MEFWVIFAAVTVAQFALWGFAYVCVKDVEVFKEKPAIAAFNLAQTVPVLALSYYGLLSLHYVTQQPATLMERMYGYDHDAEMVCIIQISMQFYKTAVAVSTGDAPLLKPDALGHHAVTVLAMWVCLYPFGHSYAGIFFGLTELSTVPLNFVDTYKNFKSLREIYPTTELIAKACFALLFLSLRVGLTGMMSYYFQKDLFELITSGQAHSVPAVLFCSAANLFTCGLQAYWATLIIKGIRRQLSPKKQTSEEAEEEVASLQSPPELSEN